MSNDRFTVTKTSEHYGSEEKFINPITDTGVNCNEKSLFRNSYAEVDITPTPALALYEEEIQERPRVTTFLKALSSYTNIIPQSKDEQDEDATHQVSVKSPKLNTLMGVYLPCVQNILGVILFVRLPWIVGLAGILQAFLIVFLCVCTTLLTSISMSAIATNGVVPAGGSYFMISRALGPEFGGAVGFLFYLGTTFASSLYILGAVEILLSYIASNLSLFGEFSGPENKANLFNNFRVYGTMFLLLMSVLVFVGVKVVNKFASVFLACVIISILSIYIGIIKSGFASPNLHLCFIGNRLLQELQGDKVCGKYTTNSSTNMAEPTSLYKQYCKEENGIWQCDPYFEENNVSSLPAIPGLGSSYVEENVGSNYLIFNNPVTSPYLSYIDVQDPSSIHGIVADLTSSFTLLLAIFFPSVTGIMAGSNRSGDLADGQLSIPKGTISAVLTTGFIYLSCVVLFGLSVQRPLLQDKFGDSIGKELIVSILAWPTKWVVLIGAFLSTIGAGLQSLTGAPRLLQAIGKDGLIPVLNIFAHGKKNGEPTWALLLTFIVSCCGILIADLDFVAPIITMFFLMCYMFVNLACALHSLLRTPNWRPRYEYYNWLLSLIGATFCITLMFISSWYYALGALIMAATLYKYIEYSGAQKEWGDGLTGLQLTTARFALLRLEHRPPHTKNWRPQLLVMVKLDESKNITQEHLLSIAEQLKAGRGLTVVAAVYKGNSLDSSEDVEEIQFKLASSMEQYNVKGFHKVCVCNSVFNGLSCIIQTTGLGGLYPNTIVIGWPYNPGENSQTSGYLLFLSAIREASAQQKAILIPKYSRKFPKSRDPAQRGTIDVWWIVHDGGLLMLLPFLLRKHKVWRHCKTRIFTVAKLSDNSVRMKKDLHLFVYHLRIQAEVEVVEMHDSDISAYTYERTLRMEQRTEILQQLHLTRQESLKDVHQVIEKSRVSHHSSSKRVMSIDEIKESPSQLDGNESRMTWEQSAASSAKLESVQEEEETKPPISKPKKTNVRRMHNAIKLNEAILKKSKDASLVILNLPGPPKGSDQTRELNYMEFLEILTEQLDRVLMVRGGGREVITIYS